MGKMFLVIGQTERGDKAIKKHWEDSQKMRVHERMIMRATGYSHKLVSRAPFTVSLTITNKEIENIEFQTLCYKHIRGALSDNGANEGGDYRIEVQDV
jgi:hypothetical protein